MSAAELLTWAEELDAQTVLRWLREPVGGAS